MEDTPSSRKVAAAPALVIESDFFMAGEIRAVFEDLGLPFSVVSSVERAQSVVTEGVFSIAIFSGKCVGDLGVRIAAELRERNERIPLILLCAHDRLQRLTDPGPFSSALFIPPPIKTSEIRRRVMDALGLADTDQSGTTIS